MNHKPWAINHELFVVHVLFFRFSFSAATVAIEEAHWIYRRAKDYLMISERPRWECHSMTSIHIQNFEMHSFFIVVSLSVQIVWHLLNCQLMLMEHKNEDRAFINLILDFEVKITKMDKIERILISNWWSLFSSLFVSV